MGSEAKELIKSEILFNDKYYPHTQILGIAIKLQSEGKTQEASELYKKLIEIDFLDSRVFFNLGLIQSQQGKFDQAIELYQKSIVLKPLNPNAFNNIGLIYLEKKNYQKARINFKRAIEIDNKYSIGYSNLGQLCIREDNMILAEKYTLK